MTAIDRTTGLGGSDMAAVLGIDPYRTRYDLYLEKIGEASSFEGNELTELGTVFEEPVAQLYAQRTGREVVVDDTDYRHPDHEWAVGHIDRRIVAEPRILEIKCSSSSEWGEEGTDEIPAHYLPQVHFYMAITGAEACDVAALLWGGHGRPSLRIYTVMPSAEFRDVLLEEGARFWTDHVEARTPPDPMSSDEANRRWREVAEGETVVATDEVVEAVAMLAEIKRRQKALDEARGDVELSIKRALGHADTLVDATGAKLATWKQQSRRSLDQKALAEAHPEIIQRFQTETTFRVLRQTKRSK